MCPEDLAWALELLAGPYTFSDDERPFGVSRDDGAGLSAAYRQALPTLALGYRLWADTQVCAWLQDLESMDDPSHRIAELAKGAPRGVGRQVIAEMLTRAVRGGGRSQFVTVGAFAAFEGAVREDHDPKRAPKHGVHDLTLGLATTADRIVRALVAYPNGIEPAKNPEAARRAAQRLLQEVAAKILRSDRPSSPSRARRIRR